jgi:hypothetical protein
MRRRFDVHFEEDPPIDEVVFAVAPLDAFTGQIVRGDVAVRIKGLPHVRPVRNLSGLAVFINLPDPPEEAGYRVVIDAERAGYFDPDEVLVPPPEVDDPDRQWQFDVPLHRLPSTILAGDATTVAGVVVVPNAAAPEPTTSPVEGALITATIPWAHPNPAQAPQPFATRTDARGAFVLPLRLDVDPEDDDRVTFTFQHGARRRWLARRVIDGKFHRFAKPIVLTDPDDSDEPELLIGESA